MSPEPSLGSALDSPEDFWRLLPVAQNPRRESNETEAMLSAFPNLSLGVSTPSSVETVKKSPLTPFLAWREELDGGRAPSTDQVGACRERHDDQDQESAAPTIEHACGLATLAGQCLVALATLSVFVAVFVREKGKAQSGVVDSWSVTVARRGTACVSITRMLTSLQAMELDRTVSRPHTHHLREHARPS